MTRTLFSWRPFTHAKSAAPPKEIVRASKTILFDKSGSQYIDAISSWWVITHGHCHPHIREAIQKTANNLDQIVYANFTHAPARELLNKMSELLPNEFAAAFFSDNGSTSVEVALKMALQYWRIAKRTDKNKIVSFVGAYHGDTAGCMSVSSRGLFTDPYQAMLFDVVQFEDAITSLSENTAAIIVEPLVQGAGGMIMWDEEYLRSILHAARKKNILVIFDEVMTGFFRTGSLFAFLSVDFVPDILCLSKGLTGGALPLSLTICRENIYQSFFHDDKARTLFHGHTFTANPLSCAAALANLELMDESFLPKITAIENIHRIRLSQIKNKIVKDKRMRGTIAVVELEGIGEYLGNTSQLIASFCMDHGVFLRPIGNVIYLMPPYCITKSELSHCWDVVEMAITMVEKL